MSQQFGTKRNKYSEVYKLEKHLNLGARIDRRHEHKTKAKRTQQNRLEAAQLKLKLARSKAKALNAQPLGGK